MSLTPRLTLIGLNNYNAGLFDLLELPAGVDRETFIESLLLKYGECPVIYPNYTFMRLAIGSWSKKWAAPFARILATLEADYNPLHNYDRFEEYTDTEERAGSTTGTGSTTVTNNLLDTESESGTRSVTTSGTETATGSETETTTGSSDETVTHGKTVTEETTVSAMNMTTYQPDSKKTAEEGGTTATAGETEGSRETETETEVSRSGTESESDQRSRTLNRGGTVTTADSRSGSDTGTREFQHDAHLYGNIGVTTSQEMARAELDLRLTSNLYDIITDVFRNELLLYIY